MFEEMINNGDEEKAWHNNGIYRTNRRQAKEDYYNKQIAYCYAEIQKYQSEIAKRQKEWQEYEQKISGLTD